MDEICIIIVHHNNDVDTKECLFSLEQIKTKDFSHRVIVVDNASTKHFKLPRALKKSSKYELIRSESNLGFTGGNNLGMHYAKQHYDPDYYLLLNNDTTVDPNFLIHLHSCSRANVKAGLITSKIYFSKGYEFHNSYQNKDKGKILWYVGGCIDWPNMVAFHPGVDEVDRGHFDGVTIDDFATGCVMLIPKLVFEKVGYLDKRYFLYLEDVDYSLKVKEAGFTIKICSESIVWHKNAGAAGSGSDLQQYYQERNRLFFTLLHAPWRYKLTAIKVCFVYLLFGSYIKRKAVIDLFLQNMGKQPLV